MYETFLTSVPILASLEGYERAKIADALETRTFQSGERVIREGESGDEFYIIESGTALVEKSDAGVIGELKRGDYFGGELGSVRAAANLALMRSFSCRTCALEPRASSSDGQGWGEGWREVAGRRSR